jgi:predicted polyphosphate/ATP-dependent NAD kinase
MKIAFLVNPIAGLGGKVGLKGTDGVVDEAIRRGAKPISGQRARECLDFIQMKDPTVEILTCSGSMGADYLNDFDFSIIYDTPSDTSSQDTRDACMRFIDGGAQLLVFCGGDGTARDVYNAIQDQIPVIGIPAGVKMHSSVFAINPKAAAKLLLAFIDGNISLTKAEVLDVDEEAYRKNELRTRLYGYMQVPYLPEFVQASKSVFSSGDDEESKFSIAVFACEFMRDGSAYILGAGTTTAAIAKQAGLEKTLLGVDVIKDGKLILKDAQEAELLGMLQTEHNAKIIVTPIGAQGFVFGRGTQQISPQVITKVGLKNILYVATPAKLNSTPHLVVDTGDTELDRQLSGYRSVIMGYRMSQRKDIRSIT